VLAQPGISAAIVGASRPQQIADNVRASGVTLEPDVLARIDEVLAGVVERDPERTQSPSRRP
jgi:aryl-alcohol dehydrogenase-like predicted oxidoreductase